MPQFQGSLGPLQDLQGERTPRSASDSKKRPAEAVSGPSSGGPPGDSKSRAKDRRPLIAYLLIVGVLAFYVGIAWLAGWLK